MLYGLCSKTYAETDWKRTANLAGEKEQSEVFMVVVSSSTMIQSHFRVPGQNFKTVILLFHYTSVELLTIVIQRQDSRIKGEYLLAPLTEKFLWKTLCEILV